ncbi:MAG: B12-binding domain-containing radical SAM protein [Nanoarchaeota archaeon]|nr:B12-binding domain-containing radical SAM protein [Nanoarchaeota archaeon]MBU1269272.1 B12-binding domain-containing radical SAM protein [Nanoarchaeota archaeon]MBU1604199.1 B12-binding domain-containing radical SAM protein [Nanoarchaeota archaeon]MBU2442621.1 B12-binding domain-containing radical SAM protein [Nanoarchaeota archaeon]
MEKKLLLVNPHWREETYLSRKIKIAAISHPPLSLAIIASYGLKAGYDVKVLDLDLYDDPWKELKKTVKDFNPSIVGVTCLTPFFNKVVKISLIVKKFSKAKVIVGGPHATALPNNLLNNKSIDVVVVGEGEPAFESLFKNDFQNLESVKNIAFKKGELIIRNPSSKEVYNPNLIPYPSWHLFELEKYVNSYILSRKNPVGPIETSRGCPYSCIYCNKTIFGTRVRYKSVLRVVDEMRFYLSSGFKELHIQDDLFSFDLKRAKNICDTIISEKLVFPWVLLNGIRVDSVDEELFVKLKKSGCYMVSFGIESGSQKVLDSIPKKIKLKDVETAVNLAKKSGLMTFGFFLFGLPAETRETMQQTIDFSKKLNLDIAKFAIVTPFPGTKLFDYLDSSGLINTYDWSKYFQHSPTSKVFKHPNVSWDDVNYFYNNAYKTYYLRSGYVFRRFILSLKNRTLIRDVLSFIKINLSF